MIHINEINIGEEVRIIESGEPGRVTKIDHDANMVYVAAVRFDGTTHTVNVDPDKLDYIDPDDRSD